MSGQAAGRDAQAVCAQSVAAVDAALIASVPAPISVAISPEMSKLLKATKLKQLKLKAKRLK